MAQRHMYPAAVNSPATVLVSNINASTVSITVENASILPSAPNLLIISPESENAETVRMTVKNGNILTVERGFQGTVRAWDAGTRISRSITAYDHDTFKDNIEDLETQAGNLEEKTGALEGQVGGLENEIGGLSGQVGSLGQQVDVLEGDVDGLEDQVGNLDADLRGLAAVARSGNYNDLNNLPNILAQVLSGFAVGGNTPVTAANSILTALQNLQGQVNARGTSNLALSSPITGFSAGGNAVLLASDTILQALGKLQGQVSARGTGNLNLSSQITGYVLGLNTALVATDTLLAALGKIQGQINARITLASAIVGYVVGANAALVASDSLLGALGKLQGQINALAASSGGDFVRDLRALTSEQLNDTRPLVSFTGTITSAIAASVGLPSGTFRIESFPSATLGWSMQRATGIGGTVARQVFVRSTAQIDQWSAWSSISGGVRNIQTGQFTIPTGTNVGGSTHPTIPVTTVASTARSLPVVYGGGGVAVTNQQFSSQRVVIQECRMSNTSSILVQLSPVMNLFLGGTALTSGALMRFFLLEHNA